MKHFFIVNITSGLSSNGHKDLMEDIRRFIIAERIDGVIYKTKGVMDAHRYTKHMCNSHVGTYKRFYACGGDGTVNEIASALVGMKEADLALVPCGTGNDYAQNFSGYSKATTFKQLSESGSRWVDVMKVNDRYCVNICNIGFDAVVADNMNKMKKIPLVSGRATYYLSLIYSFVKHIGVKLEIRLDDGNPFIGNYIFSLFAKGKRYGGGFLANPNAVMDNGKLFFCGVKKISRLSMAKLIPVYQKGLHVNAPADISGYFDIRECSKASVVSNERVVATCDGEVFYATNLEISVVKKAIKVVDPDVLPLQPKEEETIVVV